MRRWIREEFAYISHKRDLGISDLEEEQRIRQELQLPMFDHGNPVHWIYQLEDLFHFFLLNEDEKLKVAVLSMGGDALRWFEWEHQRRPFFRWEDLRDQMMRHFCLTPVSSGLMQGRCHDNPINLLSAFVKVPGEGQYSRGGLARDLKGGSSLFVSAKFACSSDDTAGGVTGYRRNSDDGTYCRCRAHYGAEYGRNGCVDGERNVREQVIKGGRAGESSVIHNGSARGEGLDADNSCGGGGALAKYPEKFKRGDAGGSSLDGGGSGGVGIFTGSGGERWQSQVELVKGRFPDEGSLEKNLEENGKGNFVKPSKNDINNKIGVLGPRALHFENLEIRETDEQSQSSHSRHVHGSLFVKPTDSHFDEVTSGSGLILSRPNLPNHPTNLINQIHSISFPKFFSTHFSTLHLTTPAFLTRNTPIQSGRPQNFQPNTLAHCSKAMSNVPHSIPISQTQFLQNTIPIPQSTLMTTLLYHQSSQLPKPNCTYNFPIPPDQSMTTKPRFMTASCYLQAHFTIAMLREEVRQWKPGSSFMDTTSNCYQGRECSANYYPP